MKKYTICVLGATGFIGRPLVTALQAQGHTVHVFSRKPCPTSWQNNTRIKFFQGNYFVKKDVLKALRGCDICIHLLWTSIPATSNENIPQDAQENILGTLQLLECLRETGVGKLIFSSSAGTVYGACEQELLHEDIKINPICAYGVSKLCVEKYLDVYALLHGIHYVCLRIANPYGPGQEENTQQGAVGIFLAKVLQGDPIHIWGDGSVVRDFVYIDDVIQAFLLSVSHTEPRLLVNIGSGKGMSLNALLQIIEKITGKKPLVQYKNMRKCDVKRSVASIKKAYEKLKWQPKVDIEEGIEIFYKTMCSKQSLRLYYTQL